MTTSHATGAHPLPRPLSPRRLTASDRIGRIRRSQAARDLRRVTPRTSVALLTGLLLAGLILGLLQLRAGHPVSFGQVNGQ